MILVLERSVWRTSESCSLMSFLNSRLRCSKHFVNRWRMVRSRLIACTVATRIRHNSCWLVHLTRVHVATSVIPPRNAPVSHMPSSGTEVGYRDHCLIGSICFSRFLEWMSRRSSHERLHHDQLHLSFESRLNRHGVFSRHDFLTLADRAMPR